MWTVDQKKQAPFTVKPLNLDGIFVGALLGFMICDPIIVQAFQAEEPVQLASSSAWKPELTLQTV